MYMVKITQIRYVARWCKYNTVLQLAINFYPPIFVADDGVGNNMVLVDMLHKQGINVR